MRERVAFAIRGQPSQPPHLQLAVLAHLNQIGPFLLHEVEPDADRFHALLPHLVELAIARRRRRRHGDRERLAVGLLAIAFAVALTVTELVQQCVRGRRIVLNCDVPALVVTGKVGRNRLGRGNRLSLVDDTNQRRPVEADRNCPPQRDAVPGVATDKRILHVEVRVLQGGLRNARQYDAARCVLRPELS